MSEGSYIEVETNDRPSFCSKNSKAIILFIAVLVFVVVVVVVLVVLAQTTNNSTPPPTLSNLTGENDIVTKMKLKDDPFEGLCDIGSDSVNKTLTLINMNQAAICVRNVRMEVCFHRFASVTRKFTVSTIKNTEVEQPMTLKRLVIGVQMFSTINLNTEAMRVALDALKLW
ncbi:unnamed protein product [Mytilus edulis]|uniref:Transmembrane protein n=1 Tax=Mytilus edulis TaxID=6550 RepID=A0A8S3U735_MYTED|nr:unnamed protein product [Mytilus edulis]